MKIPRHAVFGSLLALGLLAAQGSPKLKRAVEIRIGEIDSLSGVLAAQGTAVHEGVVYAVSEVNARGGILGSSVKLVTRDDGSRPDEATEADAVRAALSQTDLKLPLEHLRFEAHGDPLHYEVGVFQIQKGRHVLLYPRDRATGKLIGPKP